MTIEYVGSCSTLIAEKLLSSRWKFRITNEIAYLLTGKRIEINREQEEERKKTKIRDKNISF